MDDMQWCVAIIFAATLIHGQHAGSGLRVTSHFEKSPNNSVPIRNENEIKNILQNRRVQIDT